MGGTSHDTLNPGLDMVSNKRKRHRATSYKRETWVPTCEESTRVFFFAKNQSDRDSVDSFRSTNLDSLVYLLHLVTKRYSLKKISLEVNVKEKWREVPPLESEESQDLARADSLNFLYLYFKTGRFFLLRQSESWNLWLGTK